MLVLYRRIQRGRKLHRRKLQKARRAQNDGGGRPYATYFVTGQILQRHESSALPEEVVDERNSRVLLADSLVRAEYSRKCFGIIRPSTIAKRSDKQGDRPADREKRIYELLTDGSEYDLGDLNNAGLSVLVDDCAQLSARGLRGFRGVWKCNNILV